MKTTWLSTLALAVFVTTGLGLQATTFADATDNASNSPYADGWDNGDNGGTGFEMWALSSTADTNELNAIYGNDPHFIDGVGVGPLPGNLLGPPAFGLTNSNELDDLVAAARLFDLPLEVGQSLYVEIDGSALEGDLGIGNLVELIGTDGATRFEVGTANGEFGNNWSYNASDTLVAAEDMFTLMFTLKANDRFDLSMTDSGGSGFGVFNGQLSGTAGAAINQVRFSTFGTGSSSDGAREMFINNLRITGNTIPEPASGLLLSMVGIIGMATRRRR